MRSDSLWFEPVGRAFLLFLLLNLTVLPLFELVSPLHHVLKHPFLLLLILIRGGGIASDICASVVN